MRASVFSVVKTFHSHLHRKGFRAARRNVIKYVLMFLDHFLVVLTQVGVLFALMSVGFVCNRMKVFGVETIRGLTAILFLVVTPALMIHVFQRPFDQAKLCALGETAALSFLIQAIGVFAARLVCVRDDASRERTLRFAVIFSNVGFMGIPLQQAVLGDEGVFFGGIYVAAFNVLCWTYGLRMMSGQKGQGGLFHIVFNPGLSGILIGLPLFLCSARLPVVLGEPVRMLASLNTPLAMLVLGYYLAESNILRTLRVAQVWLTIALRLVALPLVAVGLLAVLLRVCDGLDRTMLVSLIIAAAAPAAALTTVFAVRYGRDVSISVGTVALTSLLSALTIPPVVALALTIFS